MTQDEATRTIEQAEEAYARVIERCCQAVIRDARDAFQARFPKRSIEFLDAMGSCQWIIDGVTAYEDGSMGYQPPTARPPSARRARIFAPLFKATDWYLDHSDRRVAICVEA